MSGRGFRTLRRLMGLSVGLYALFTIPTFLLLQASESQAMLVKLVRDTWQATFWQLPGLSEYPSRILLDGLVIVAVIVLGLLFYEGFQRLNRELDTEGSPEARLKIVLLWTLLAGLVLAPVIPFHSSDLYGYINRGIQQSLYHVNPYVTPVADIPGWKQEPLFQDHWVRNPSPYGFLFMHLTKLLTGWAGRQYLPMLLLFKLANLLALLGCVWLVYRLGERLNLKRPWLGAYLLGANPLVLLHAMGNGHNDILMVFLLLASLWALFSERWRWAALPLLAASVFTKYATLLAAPLILLYFIRRKAWRPLGIGMIVSLGLTWLLAAPYIDQPWPWRLIVENAGRPQHSVADLLARLVYYPVKMLEGKTAAQAVMALALKGIKPLLLLGFIGFYGWRAWTLWRQPVTPQRLVFEIGLVMTALVAFVSAKFHPWYPVMFLPVVLLLPETSRLRQFGLVFGLFQLAGFAPLQNLHVFNVLLLTLLPLWWIWRGCSLFRPVPGNY